MTSLPVIRRGEVQGHDASGRLRLLYWNSHHGGVPVPPLYLGGAQGPSGVCTTPLAGDEVAVLHEDGYPIATVPASHSGTAYPVAPPAGATYIYGPSGQVLFAATSAGVELRSATTTSGATGGSATALPAQPVGYLSLTVNGAVVKLPYYA